MIAIALTNCFSIAKQTNFFYKTYKNITGMRICIKHLIVSFCCGHNYFICLSNSQFNTSIYVCIKKLYVAA